METSSEFIFRAYQALGIREAQLFIGGSGRKCYIY